ncbi:MAG: LPS export ABC transporter periplasmic protein LptC [Rhizobiales bacterium]|nr:LPS export ABC transporter periplasmic protein LptC [Hyphomicrobiales bacterium]
MMRKLALVSAAILVLALGQHGFAQDTPKAAKATTAAKTTTTEKKGKPVDIESDRMEIREKENKAIFTGSVVAKRPDVTLNADTLVVDYGEVKQPDGTTKNDVTHLDAKGNVVIITDKERITGDWAKMNPKTNILDVGGGVTVTQGETVLSGQLLHANLDTDQMDLTGGRVKGSFVPK